MATTGKSSTFDNDLLKLIFNATPISLIADNAVTTPLTNLYVSLHVSNPDVAGSQTTGEISYTNYARQAVARSSGGFTVAGASVTPVAAITFPASAGGTGGTVTNFAIGTALTGTGKVLYFGPVSPTIAVSNGVTPQLTVATSVTEA